jgi:hypothetical protein
MLISRIINRLIGGDHDFTLETSRLHCWADYDAGRAGHSRWRCLDQRRNSVTINNGDYNGATTPLVRV